MSAGGFKIGDIVWVRSEGDPLRKVTWEILAFTEDSGGLVAILKSGQSGVRRRELLGNLVAFRAQEVAQ